MAFLSQSMWKLMLLSACAGSALKSMELFKAVKWQEVAARCRVELGKLFPYDHTSLPLYCYVRIWNSVLTGNVEYSYTLLISCLFWHFRCLFLFFNDCHFAVMLVATTVQATALILPSSNWFSVSCNVAKNILRSYFDKKFQIFARHRQKLGQKSKSIYKKWANY